MTSALRLAWRMQRWEMALLVGAPLVLTVVALILPSTEGGGGDPRMIVLFLTLVGPMEERSTLVPVEERSSDPIIAVLEYETISISSTGELILTEPECDTQASCMAATAELTHAVRVVPGSAYLPLLEFAAAASLIIVVTASAATVGVITRFGPS